MSACNFCYESLDECNCPSDMTPRRQTGQQYYEALINANRPPKKQLLLSEGNLTVGQYGDVRSCLIKNDEFRKNELDKHVTIDLKYLGLPAGKRLKVTIEVLDDENG